MGSFWILPLLHSVSDLYVDGANNYMHEGVER